MSLISLLENNPMTFVVLLVAIIIALSVHEYSHALAAKLLGDPTAEREGRLTLNPLAHIDILGMLMLILFRFGWGKPVPYNPFNLKNRKLGEALIAIAGPLANLITAIAVGLIVRALNFFGYYDPENLMIVFFQSLMFINLALMLFNLIPIYPLDGSKILFSLLPEKLYYIREVMERYGIFILLFLVFFFSDFFRFLIYIIEFLMNLIL
jgi:Zn-dependent protease